MRIIDIKRTTRYSKPARFFQSITLLIAAIILAACGTFRIPITQRSSPLTTTQASSSSIPQTGQGQIFQISVLDDNFKPAELTVPLGATVVWTTIGHDQHTITADDKSFKSETLNTGATFKYTFTRVGTFLYHCDFHGFNGGLGMSGAVTVVPSGSSSIK